LPRAKQHLFFIKKKKKKTTIYIDPFFYPKILGQHLKFTINTKSNYANQ